MNKTSTEQYRHLKAVRDARHKLTRARTLEKSALRNLHTLIRDGFKQEIGGPKLADASGLSLPRVYQIRNQEHADAEAQGTPLEAQAI